MPRVVHAPDYKISTSQPILPIRFGGTSSRTKEEAANALGAVLTSDIGRPNGPIPLIGGMIDSSYFSEEVQLRDVTLSGPLTLAQNAVGIYTITNYDFLKPYVLSASNGTLVRNGATITYTAPSTPGVSGFLINGKQYTVTITGNGVAQPQVTSPVNNAQLCGHLMVFSTSAFSVVGGSDTHVSSSWVLARDFGFTDIVAFVTNTAVYKTTWSVDNLNPDTVYYLRVSHKGAAYGDSAWSTTTSFTTKPVFYPVSETTVLVAANAVAASGLLGSHVAISGNGKIAAVGAPSDLNALSATGSVTLYELVNGFWVQKQRVLASDGAEGHLFGRSVALSTDGYRLIVGAPGAAAAYVYAFNGTVWTMLTKLSSIMSPIGTEFGVSVTINATGSRVAVGAPYTMRVASNNAGAAYVFTDAGGSWQLEASLYAADYQQDGLFGSSVALSGVGSRLVVGAPGTTTVVGSKCGTTYVFNFSISWTEVARLLALDADPNDALGCSVAINQTGTIVITGARSANTINIENSGAAYVFTYENGMWTQVKRLQSNDPEEQACFGCAVAINNAGTIALVGAPKSTVFSSAQAGRVFAFIDDGTDWLLYNQVNAVQYNTEMRYGQSVGIDGQGIRAVVGILDNRTRPAQAHIVE